MIESNGCAIVDVPAWDVSARRKLAVFTTFGTLGDLLPFLGLASEWMARGHQAIMAAPECYRKLIEEHELEFRPIRPDRDPGLRAPGRVLDGYILPHLRASYDDLLAASEGADLLVARTFILAADLVAEKLEIPWAIASVSPVEIFSAYDPPALKRTWMLPYLSKFSPRLTNVFFQFAMQRRARKFEPWHQLRAEIGLSPAPAPCLGSIRSCTEILGLFSEVLAAPQPDWPSKLRQTGFVFHDGDKGRLTEEQLRFLDSGPPPVVFVLRQFTRPRRVYREFLTAVREIGCRAIIVGRESFNPARPEQSLPPEVAEFQFAPFAELFPRAAAIIHHGGVGTVAQALRVGVPQLVLPQQVIGQLDHAVRAARLGAARVIKRGPYRAARLAAELQALLTDPSYAVAAREASHRIDQENGAVHACDLLEALPARCVQITARFPVAENS